MTDLSSLSKIPMVSESDIDMVEIILLKWKVPNIESESVSKIIHHTSWPFKLVVYDNRWNTPNAARIWNKLIRQATCEYICLLDSDAFVPSGPEPCWLTRMMETFSHHPDCKLVIPVTNRCSSPQQKVPVEAYPSVERNDEVWSGFCFLFRRTLMDEVGWFDEDFVGYGQDSEFSIRLARAGGGTYVRKDVFVEHVHGASFGEATRTGQYDAQADRAYAQALYLQKING